jgi:hypothetical protein
MQNIDIHRTYLRHDVVLHLKGQKLSIELTEAQAYELNELFNKVSPVPKCPTLLRMIADILDASANQENNHD